MLSIKDLDKAKVLCALYDRAKPQGRGYLHYTPEPLAYNEARELLAKSSHFDYLRGRVMKVKIDGDELYTALYDRDNGEGAAAEALATLQGNG